MGSERCMQILVILVIVCFVWHSVCAVDALQ
jgi:hypothetical protein